MTGHYTVEELDPPKWHLISENVTQHVQVVHGQIAEVTFYNEPFGNLRVEKYSDTGEPLSGVTIQIKHIATGETKSGQTGPGGAIEFTEPKSPACASRNSTAAASRSWRTSPLKSGVTG